ncbi:chorismate-binding protein [Fimbriimonas ginsengisoli]|nr:chorismate-binding protein [Fimbriimonas ginsengisoli]
MASEDSAVRRGGYFLDLAAIKPGDAVLRYDDPVLGSGWLYFQNPSQILAAHRPEEVAACLKAASDFSEHGGWSVGFLTYEAGATLRPEMEAIETEWPLLAWFALYAEAPAHYRELLPVYDPVEPQDLDADWDLERYKVAFDRVKQALADGETYQVNLTFRCRFTLSEDAAKFFASRCGVQPPLYAAYIDGGDWQIASFSPELLFERHGDRVTTRPMKGTARVGVQRSDTAAVAAALAKDPKSIAENIMIVDMVRNDLGAVCEVGTVEVPQLLNVERHRGLLQMTSTVTGRCARRTSDLLSSLFPAASITGAPKVATMRLIRELEGSPRHIYCGTIGVMTPTWQRFNVAIRTALVRNGVGEFGVGSGVVWDSEVEAEYRECLDKRELLLNPAPQWQILDAIGGHQIQDQDEVARHLARLAETAAKHGIPIDTEAIRKALLAIKVSPGRTKVRTTVRYDGRFEITQGPSAIAGDRIRAALASHPVASSDPNFRVKTTSRAMLEKHLDAHPEADEVLLYNEDGLVSEFCGGNVLIQLGDHLLTPHPDCGCLPGITVRTLVDNGQAEYAEIRVGDLKEAKAIYFANSVTGVLPVELSQPNLA